MAKNGFDMMALMNNASKKQAAGAARYELQNIPIEKMIPNPANEKIYEMGDIEELAQSILLSGKILQNAVVTAADESGNYTIIAGHRRRLACQKLVEEGHSEFAEIPCMVMTEPDGLMQELVLIQTNSTARVLTEAEKMRQAERATAILTELKSRKQISGRVRDIVAKMLGTTTGQLGRYNVISKGLTNETLRAAFERGELGISAAYEAARLDETGQAELAEKMKAGGATRARDAVEQQKKSEVARAAEEAKDGLPMQKEYRVDIKPKFRTNLTIKYEEKEGKFYSGFGYNTPKAGVTGPINYDTPYENSQAAIEGAMKEAAADNEYLHKALWGSGYAIVGKPEEKEAAPGEHKEFLKTANSIWIKTKKEGAEYKCTVGYQWTGEPTEIELGRYPNKQSCKAVAIQELCLKAPYGIVLELWKTKYIDEMPERFKEEFLKSGYSDRTQEKSTADEPATEEVQEAEPEEATERNKPEQKNETGVWWKKDENELRNLWIRKKAIMAVIKELETKITYKAKEADIYKDEKNSLQEEIARAEADIYAELQFFAKDNITQLDELLDGADEEFEQEIAEAE